MNTHNVKEQMNEVSKSNVETTLRFAKIYMDSAEKLLKLQLDAAKVALDESARNAKAMMETRDLQQMMTLRTRLAESSIESAITFSRSVYEVASQTQQDISSLLESRLSEFSKTMVGNADKAAKNAPPGADMAMAALKSTVAATAAAVDSMTKAAKQVADFAETSLKSASASTATAMKSAASIGKPLKK